MPITARTLREQGQRHKVFVSYYHHDDQKYRNAFEKAFKDAFIIKSVQPGDIDPGNSDDYIKKLIQAGYISDASVVVVLVGPKTKCRKHVDWEISAGLNKKVGGYSGLMGILLPEFPLSQNNTYQAADLPTRLHRNLASDYASLYRWDTVTASLGSLASAIDTAFDRRLSTSDKIVNAVLPQMQRNTCD